MSIPSSRDQVSQIIGELSGKVSSTPGLDIDNWQKAEFMGHEIFVHKDASDVNQIDGAIESADIVSRLTALVQSDRFGGGDDTTITQSVYSAKQDAGSLAGDFLQKHLTGYHALSPKDALPSKQPKKGGYGKAPTRAEVGRKKRADMRSPMGVRKPTGSTSRLRHPKRGREELQPSTAQGKRASYDHGYGEGVKSEKKRARREQDAEMLDVVVNAPLPAPPQNLSFGRFGFANVALGGGGVVTSLVGGTLFKASLVVAAPLTLPTALTVLGATAFSFATYRAFSVNKGPEE